MSVPRAWLSFDFKGLPSIEPVYSNLIVEQVNDEYDGYERGSEGWQKEIWSRCSPGLHYSGQLPPRLEVRFRILCIFFPTSLSSRTTDHPYVDATDRQGVVFKLTSEHFDHVMGKGSASTVSFRLIQLECTIFEDGDHESIVGTVRAWTPIALERLTEADLRPTLRYLRLVILGSFFSMLSQPYLGHLMLLRPLDPPSRFSSAHLLSVFYTTLLVPPFVIFYLPSWLMARFGIRSGGAKRRWLGAAVWHMCDAVEQRLGAVLGWQSRTRQKTEYTVS